MAQNPLVLREKQEELSYITLLIIISGLLPWLAVCHRRSVAHSGAHVTALVPAQVVPVG